MTTRRTFLAALAAVPLLGKLLPAQQPSVSEKLAKVQRFYPFFGVTERAEMKPFHRGAWVQMADVERALGISPTSCVQEVRSGNTAPEPVVFPWWQWEMECPIDFNAPWGGK